MIPICTADHEPLLWWGQRGEEDESGVVGAANVLWAREMGGWPDLEVIATCSFSGLGWVSYRL